MGSDESVDSTRDPVLRDCTAESGQDTGLKMSVFCDYVTHGTNALCLVIQLSICDREMIWDCLDGFNLLQGFL